MIPALSHKSLTDEYGTNYSRREIVGLLMIISTCISLLNLHRS